MSIESDLVPYLLTAIGALTGAIGVLWTRNDTLSKRVDECGKERIQAAEERERYNREMTAVLMAANQRLKSNDTQQSSGEASA